MEQAIIDNRNFLYYLFNLTAGGLYGLSLLTTFSYQFWNIFIWFGLIPATWIYLVSKRTTVWLNVISIPIFIYMFALHTWDKWFDQAVVLLNKTGSLINADYRLTSVYICLFVPYLIYLGLVWLSCSKLFLKRFLITSCIVAALVVIFFPVSNLLIEHYFKGQLPV